MAAISSGLLMYQHSSEKNIKIFLAHPGGPYFKNKNDGWWSIPKGLPDHDEDLLHTAIREFKEETGITANPPFIDLGSIVQKGGKKVYAWAFENKSQNEIKIISNQFVIEWPPKSGKMQSFPEIDAAAWFKITEALKKINQQQTEFIFRLLKNLNINLG